MKRSLLIFILSLPLSAQAFVVYDPSNFEQNLIMAKNSVKTLANQARMLELKVKSLSSLSSYQYRDISTLLNKIDEISQQGRSISYALEGIDERFEALYPTKINDQYQAHAEERTQSTMNTLRNSLASISETARSLKNERDFLGKVDTQNKSATSPKQVGQVTNELLTESIQQIQILRQLIALQSNAHTAYMANQVSQDATEKSELNKLATRIKVNESKHMHAFGLIETGS